MIECNPLQAIEYLKAVIASMATGFLTDKKTFPALRSCFRRGWSQTVSGWVPTGTPASLRYQHRKAGTTGVLSGATRDAFTLRDGVAFKIGYYGVKLWGLPLTGAQVAARRRLSGGLHGYKVGSCPQRANHPAEYANIAGRDMTKSTGRVDTIDNRITSAWNINRYLTVSAIVPGAILPDGMPIEKALKKLHAATGRTMSRKGLYYKIQGGRPKRFRP